MDSKIYMEIKLKVIVETDLTNPCDIMENLDISVFSDSENVMVLDHEVDNFQITDAK